MPLAACTMCGRTVSAIMPIRWQQLRRTSTRRFRRSGDPKPAPSRGGDSAECHVLRPRRVGWRAESGSKLHALLNASRAGTSALHHKTSPDSRSGVLGVPVRRAMSCRPAVSAFFSQHDLAAICHAARKSRYDGSRWSKLGAPPLYSTSYFRRSARLDQPETCRDSARQRLKLLTLDLSPSPDSPICGCTCAQPLNRPTSRPPP
jgi:hypothetical protein